MVLLSSGGRSFSFSIQLNEGWGNYLSVLEGIIQHRHGYQLQQLRLERFFCREQTSICFPFLGYSINSVGQLPCFWRCIDLFSWSYEIYLKLINQ
ncbi:hypothetical protein FGO68_gene5175 [Halteria grandinella]|uniref:Uncharacterized protein n=1 Tax=Halteria grandinella TaxID=5974 RepID=A0A8J8NAM7_HALGN|nr:hypothetical protein FGO68_gene5175 [Halteria grandinella]